MQVVYENTNVCEDQVPFELKMCSDSTSFFIKNLKTFTGYIQLKNFKLSAVRLQPSMDKNGKNDNYNKYKIR